MDQIKPAGNPALLGIDFRYLLSEWKQMFRAETVSKDIWAGLMVALSSLPMNLALAVAAGVGPAVGITTGIIAGVIGGLFGGQKFAMTGPAATMAVVLIEIAENYGINAIWLVGLIAGSLQILAGCFRLSRLISLLPMPVIVGFANAIGALVLFNALDDFLGLPGKTLAHPGRPAFVSNELIPNFIADLMHIWHRCFVHHEVNFYAVAIGALSLSIAYLTPKISKAVPGELVAILVATATSSLLGFKLPLIKDIAGISNILPAPHIVRLPWNDFVVLFPAAITVFMLGSIESFLTASVADGMTGSSRYRPNQELIGQGLANLAMPFFGGIPVTGTIRRTTLNIRAGARTRLSAIAHSFILLALISVLCKYAELIPLAALASVLILTGARMIEWDAMREIWKGSRTETCVALATTIVAVAVDLTAGVFAGLVLACALFIQKMSDLKLVPYGEQQADLAPDLPVCKFVRTYVVDGPLFFGAAERFIENIVIVDDVKVVILHMRAARVLDLTGVETLLSIQRQLERRGGRLVIAELPQQPLQLLERVGAIEKIGRENTYNNYRNAVVSVNEHLLSTSCKACGQRKGLGAPKDCRLHNALLDESSPIARMIEAFKGGSTPSSGAGMEWLFPIESIDDLPRVLRSTPLETLLKGQNLGLIDEHATSMPELVIGMCIDFRKSLSIPRDWSFIIRREGANMDGAEFAIALAISKGVRHMALIAHNNCAMSNTAQHRDNFVDVLTEQIGWDKKQASEFFDNHARSREIGNEIDFVLQEARRIESLFPGLKVVPLLFRVDDDKLYLIYDWLVKNAGNDSIMNKLSQRDTGQFKTGFSNPVDT